MKISPGNRNLWIRWVIANGFAEMIGLGLTFAIIAGLVSGMNNPSDVWLIILIFLATVASGAIEATLVGLGQWWAMHPWFPTITRRAWWTATLIGALTAYTLGYLPSTLMSLGQNTSQTQVAQGEPAQWIIMVLAVALGAVAGMVLSFAQWLTMRKKVAHASWWMPANMLAWMVGMPIIFWSIDVAQRLTGLIWVILFVACILLVVGLFVGTIHGAVLVWLASQVESPAT